MNLATEIQNDAEFLSSLRAESALEVYDGNLHFGEIGTADFIRWVAVTESFEGESISNFDINSAMRIFEEWVKTGEAFRVRQ